MKRCCALIAAFLFCSCLIPRHAFAQDIVTTSAAPKTKHAALAVIYANGSVTAPDISAKSIAAFGGAGLGVMYSRVQLLFELHQGSKDRVGAAFNLNGNVEGASRSMFGHAILDPQSAGTSYALKLFWYSSTDLLPELFPKSHLRWTLGMTAIRADLFWMYPGATIGTLGQVKATTLAYTACTGLMNRRQSATGQPVTVYVHPCVSYRSIEGGVAQDGNDALRASLIGTSARAFIAPELDLGVLLGNIELGVRASYFIGGGNAVDGLTGFHIIPTFLGTIPVGIPLS